MSEEESSHDPIGLTPPTAVLATLRRFLVAILMAGLAGTGTELLLIGHDEDGWQIIPLVIIGVSLGVLGWQAASGSEASLGALRLAMVLLVLSGGLGVFLHYRSNVEFQLELDASLGGLALFRKVMHAKSPPTLAPGNMALLGFLGLVYAYRYPAPGSTPVKPTHRRLT